MWKLKTLPPLIKTFTWRLIRRALATGCRAARYSTHIDEHCSACGLIETDTHLFFHCNFARAVWFSATPLRTDTLPVEDDGVQVILSLVITKTFDDSLMQRILITLWYLWKARNDQRFGQKIWTTWQVHHAVAAYINTTNLATSPTGEQGDARRDTLHDFEEEVVDANVSVACINPEMQGTSTFHVGQNSVILIRNCALDQQMQSTRDTRPSGMTTLIAETTTTPMNQIYRYKNPLEDVYLVRLPGLLHGVRCYTDASTSPDLPSLPPRNAGIGLFIINT
jgi:hypothetical protein